MSVSTAAGPRRKDVWHVAGHTIPRPHAAFPLSPSSGGMWMKKIGGRLRYFSRWAVRRNGKLEPLPDYNWRAAEAEYNRVVGDAVDGKPPADPGAMTVGGLCSWFLANTLKRLGLTDDEIAPLAAAGGDGWRKVWWAAVKGRRAETMSGRQCMEYRECVGLLVRTFGKAKPVSELRADDFTGLRAALAKQYGPVRLGNTVARVRTIFNRAAKNGLIDRLPVFGDGFVKPNRKAMLKHRAERGTRVFTADECRKLIDAADPVLKAMILLGLNCAFGPSDLGELPRSAVDLVGGFVTFPRGKTGQPRRAALWPETIAALTAARACRPAPDVAAFGDREFLTRFGRPFASDGYSSVPSKFAKLLKRLGINGHRAFYSLRHTHRTWSDGANDVNASRTVMGHVDPGIDGVYCHGVDDARLERVAAFVRTKLLGTEGGGK